MKLIDAKYLIKLCRDWRKHGVSVEATEGGMIDGYRILMETLPPPGADFGANSSGWYKYVRRTLTVKEVAACGHVNDLAQLILRVTDEMYQQLFEEKRAKPLPPECACGIHRSRCDYHKEIT